jgi:large subunit ribosomal protein L6
MSRIGKQPIVVSDKVSVQVTPHAVGVKGPKGHLTINLPSGVKVSFSEGKLVVNPVELERKGVRRNQVQANYGLVRTLLANAVKGVTEGFSKGLEMHGVGYRASVSGRTLELALGYSHPIKYEIPQGIDIKVDKQTNILVVGADKELVGRVADKIRSFRPPEPYLGKGVRYQNEVIRRKAGKSGGK